MEIMTCSTTCVHCGKYAYDAIMVSPGVLLPLCSTHAGNLRLEDSMPRLYELMHCKSQGTCRVDGGRAGGDVVCKTCGKKYYDHPRDVDYPFMTVMCDGRLVKL